ncbi:MAG TPA: MaoC family dehydratase, partial [Nocardioides sp.]|nr:MaoC family dehydratase [Nocardioides sp.]
MRVFTTFDELAEAAGEELGSSEWVEITQERVDQFAEATGDHQWIHVDVERAASGPYGGTIAHGYLTLSLIARFGAELFDVDGVSAKLNYGVNKVRFPTPVPVGSRIRAGASIAGAQETPAGVQISLQWVI